jgi:hypothetical protein
MMITIAWFFWTMFCLYKSCQRSSVTPFTSLHSTTQRTYQMAMTLLAGRAVGLVTDNTPGSSNGDCRFVNSTFKA